MEQRQDLAAQLLHQLAVNAKLRTAIKLVFLDIERYGGANGDKILKKIKQSLEKVLYET